MTCYSKNKLCSTIVHGKHPWQSMVSTKNKVRSSFYEVIFEKSIPKKLYMAEGLVAQLL